MSANSAGTTRCARRTCSTPCWPGLQAGGFFDIPGIPPIEALQYPLAMPGTNGNVEFNTLASTAAPPTVSNSWSDTSPRAVLDYKLTPDTMIYGSVTRGYQAGGYNFALPASHYEPETVWNLVAYVLYLADRRRTGAIPDAGPLKPLPGVAHVRRASPNTATVRSARPPWRTDPAAFSTAGLPRG